MISTKLTETLVQASKPSHGTRYLHHGGGKSRRAVGCMQDMETLDLGQTLNVLRSESRPVSAYFPENTARRQKLKAISVSHRRPLCQPERSSLRSLGASCSTLSEVLSSKTTHPQPSATFTALRASQVLLQACGINCVASEGSLVVAF